MMRWRHSFLRDSRGAAAAELALMLPLLVTLLFVTFEGGYFLWSEHKVVKGVRDGARYAGRQPFSRYDCGTGTVNDSGLETRIKRITRTGYPTGDNPHVAGSDNPTVSGWTDAGVTVSVISCQTGAGGLYGGNGGIAPVLRVRATVPYPASPLTGLAATLGFDADGMMLRAQADTPAMGL